ncbi:MAG: AmmeMemoRadiSam system protein B [Planctomycetota bacterium]|nr:AmmeMemoRadiSam system protein B [Planctomycetota bacterium]
MMVREPVVAGRFYPATREECLRHIAALMPKTPFEGGPERPVAGIVPHAGWFFSGETALAVLGAISAKRTPKTFVIFGAVHTGGVRHSAVFPSGGWQTPLGLAQIDERLAGEILARGTGLVADDPQAHEDEHSIEVQVPLVQHLAPEAKIVPIAVLPDEKAAAVGRLVGEVIRSLGADAVCLGSTDLTHYGSPYGFTPMGHGEAGVRWMRQENDRRMLDLMAALDADAVVAEARTHWNACGAGAVAATLAAARQLGAARGHVVRYTTSYDVMRERTGRTDAEAAVGYGGVVF